MTTILERLQAVLCDPEGRCCITGSEADRAEIDTALADLALLEARTPPEATGSRWASDQYQKIQDFVIGRQLFRGSPPDKSHADIVLELAAKALEGDRADPKRQANWRTSNEGNRP